MKITNKKMRQVETSVKSRKIVLPKIISLFCGAGGMDLGFKQEGFEIPLAIDFEAAAIETHKCNFSTTNSITADLTELGPAGVLKHVLKIVKKGSHIGVIGGPPCQGFSRANPAALADDPRNLLPALYIQIIGLLQKNFEVDFVVFENVLGMKDKKHAPKYEALIQGLQKLGFDVHEKVLCALDFGVPQKRQRIVVSAIKGGLTNQPVDPQKIKGQSTVREAIGQLSEPAFFARNLAVEEIPLHPNHWTMKPKSARFTQLSSPGSATRSFRRLSWDKPSPTIAFGNREIHLHPEGKRRLSIYEAMLLQGFPSKFILKGNLSQQVKQISNAVPPPLARSVAAALKTSIKGK